MNIPPPNTIAEWMKVINAFGETNSYFLVCIVLLLIAVSIYELKTYWAWHKKQVEQDSARSGWSRLAVGICLAVLAATILMYFVQWPNLTPQSDKIEPKKVPSEVVEPRINVPKSTPHKPNEGGNSRLQNKNNLSENPKPDGSSKAEKPPITSGQNISEHPDMIRITLGDDIHPDKVRTQPAK